MMGRWILLMVFVGAASVPHAADLSVHYNDAKAFGSTFNPGIMNTAKDAAAAPTILPMYGTTSAEAALMGDGKMSVAAPATVKVTDCEFNPADPDRYKRQECEAINFWRKNPTVRPQYTISRSTDPVVTKVNTIRANPQATIGPMPTLTGSYSGCQTTSTGGTPITEIETCEETAVIESKTCERTREVEVDADFDYECNASQKKLDYPTCNKVLTVAVTVGNSCTNGTWFNVGWADSYSIEAYCDHANQTTIRLRFNPTIPPATFGNPVLDFVGEAYVPKSPFTIESHQELMAVHMPPFSNDRRVYLNVIAYTRYTQWGFLPFGIGYTRYPQWGFWHFGTVFGYAAGNHGCIGDVCEYSFRYGGGVGYDYQPINGVPHYVGFHITHPSTIANTNVVFAPPGTSAITHDTWDNQCAPLEARE